MVLCITITIFLKLSLSLLFSATLKSLIAQVSRLNYKIECFTVYYPKIEQGKFDLYIGIVNLRCETSYCISCKQTFFLMHFDRFSINFSKNLAMSLIKKMSLLYGNIFFFVSDLWIGVFSICFVYYCSHCTISIKFIY